MRPRWRSVGGVLGPTALIGTWAVLGTRLDGYSPVNDPISRLAAEGASTRVAMNAGFVAYAIGVLPFARTLRTQLLGGAGTAAAIGALGGLAIAATPLDSSLGGRPHVVAAGITYVAVAAAPLLATRSLARRGGRGRAVGSVAGRPASAASRAGSATGTGPTGLWQRLGLTIGHAWLIAAAGQALVGRRDLPEVT